MELIRGLHNLRDEHVGCVLTIGKFDGVHLGHRAVLKNLVSKAKEMELPATVMVFEPQPEEVFHPESAPARLSVLRDKYEQLKSLGVDRLVVVRFNKAFASKSAESFVEDLLVAQLGVRFLVVGDDFRFGCGRRGDFDMLVREGELCGFDVVSTQSYRMKDCRISSTAIRSALENDDFSLAASMMGRDYSMAGTVVHGHKRGRTIGFPTANVPLNMTRCPCNGVFAVKVAIDEQHYDGVANIGFKPTVNGNQRLLEVHIFDYEKVLYGRRIRVYPTAKIRDEQTFDSFEQLKEQIAKDAEQAKLLLASGAEIKQSV